MTDAKNSRLCLGQDGSATVIFDLSLHSETSIKKAIYKFASDFSTLLEKTSENSITAYITFPASMDQDSKSKLLSALCNEVIDQDLREQIFVETEGTRNLILAQAFSKTNLLSEE